MKVVLSVSENWARNYLVDIPDDTPPEKWDDEATAAYLKWLNRGAEFADDNVRSYSDPEYIDDGPSSSFFVTGVDEFGE